jgi:hypothetical protein
MRFTLLVLSVFFWHNATIGQPTNFKYKDYSYSDQIKSIRFNLQNKPISLPIIPLRSNQKLQLSFDDLAGGFSDLAYRIIHCTKDWKPTDLIDIEYIEGFNDELIELYFDSKTQYVDYTHYSLELPNEDLAWTKSGNYLLVVYDVLSNEALLTRRFVVYENKVDIWYRFVRPQLVSKIKEDHAIEIKIENETFPISRPNSEVFATVIQNGVWSNAIQNLQPKFTNGNYIFFTDFNKISFPALKEFRSFDTRSLDITGLNTHSMDITEDGIFVLLEMDDNRNDRNYLFNNDANGQFFIDRYNDIRTLPLQAQNRSNLAEIFNVQSRDQGQSGFYGSDFINLQSEFINYNSAVPPNYAFDIAEYTEVIFTLDLKYEKDHDIFLLGAFNDYQPYREFKMEYDPDRQIYIGSSFFKQGYYNYMYGIFEDEKINFVEYEGSYFETENNYTTLIYFSEFGSLYDRVIGHSSFNANSF